MTDNNRLSGIVGGIIKEMNVAEVEKEVWYDKEVAKMMEDISVKIYPEGNWVRPLEGEKWTTWLTEQEALATKYYNRASKPLHPRTRKLVSLWMDILSNQDDEPLIGKGWMPGQLDLIAFLRDKQINPVKVIVSMEYQLMIKELRSKAKAMDWINLSKDIAEKEYASMLKEERDEETKAYAVESKVIGSRIVEEDSEQEFALSPGLFEEELQNYGDSKRTKEVANRAYLRLLEKMQKAFVVAIADESKLASTVGDLYKTCKTCRHEFFHLGKEGHKSKQPLLRKDHWRELNNWAADFISHLKPDMSADKVPSKLHGWEVYAKLKNLKASDELADFVPLTKVGEDSNEEEWFASQDLNPEQLLMLWEQDFDF